MSKEAALELINPDLIELQPGEKKLIESGKCRVIFVPIVGTANIKFGGNKDMCGYDIRTRPEAYTPKDDKSFWVVNESKKSILQVLVIQIID